MESDGTNQDMVQLYSYPDYINHILFLYVYIYIFISWYRWCSKNVYINCHHLPGATGWTSPVLSSMNVPAKKKTKHLKMSVEFPIFRHVWWTQGVSVYIPETRESRCITDEVPQGLGLMSRYVSHHLTKKGIFHIQQIFVAVMVKVPQKGTSIPTPVPSWSLRSLILIYLDPWHHIKSHDERFSS